jgi:hypothetical protein
MCPELPLPGTFLFPAPQRNRHMISTLRESLALDRFIAPWVAMIAAFLIAIVETILTIPKNVRTHLHERGVSWREAERRHSVLHLAPSCPMMKKIDESLYQLPSPEAQFMSMHPCQPDACSLPISGWRRSRSPATASSQSLRLAREASRKTVCT